MGAIFVFYIIGVIMKKYIVKVFKILCSCVLVILYQCPIRLLFGVECPGCGLTAAVLAAAKFDFKSAFSYHPLFLMPIITIVYLSFRKKCRLPKTAEIVIGVSFLSAFIIRYVLKFF